jgi:hypothetical protein
MMAPYLDCETVQERGTGALGRVRELLVEYDPLYGEEALAGGQLADEAQPCRTHESSRVALSGGRPSQPLSTHRACACAVVRVRLKD